MTKFAPTGSMTIDLLSNEYTQAMEFIPAGMVWLDADGLVLGVNSRFAQALGFEKGTFKQKTIFQLVPYLQFSAWQKFWEQLLQTQQYHTSFIFQTANGDNCHLHLQTVLLKTNQTQPICCGILELPLGHEQDFLTMTHGLNKIGNWRWNIVENQFVLTREVCQLLEVPAAEGIIAADWLRDALKERLYPKEYSRLRQQLNACLSEGTQVDIEFSMQMPSSNKERRFRCIAVPAQMAGQTAHIDGTIQDISDIVDRTEEMYLTKYCLDNVKDMVYWVDAQGDLRYVNEQMCQMLGFTREELLGMKFKELRADFNETLWHFQWEEFRKGKILELEIIFKCKDGRELPIFVTGYHLQFRGNEVACIFGKDLQLDKRREEILRLTRYSLNNTQEMVYWVRQDGSFYYFNDAFAAKIGYTKAEIQKKRLLDIFPGFTEENFQQGWERLRKDEISSKEHQILHRNGFLIPVQAYVTLISVDGETCACGILSDISERKRKEEELNEALAEIKRLQEQYALDNMILKQEIAVEYQFNNIISVSPAYKKVLKQVEQAAQLDQPLLLLGETGTGKELLVHALHRLSNRASRPLVKINCGMMPEHLLESELFGHEKGAFPGAFQLKRGCIELAHGGTLFLNEIADLPLLLQERLLHVLQQGESKRMGGTEAIKINVRIVAASSRDLETWVQEGRFNNALYKQLRALSIFNLPLRERHEDIPLLVEHFVQKSAARMSKPIPTVSKKVMDELRGYAFPGNVRELENIIERAVLLSRDGQLKLESFFSNATAATTTTFKSLEQIQRDHILEALRKTKGQITGENGAAKLLKMNDKTLYSKLQKLKIERHEYFQ